ncbi:hypothetical protein LTS15_008688 [Exophiala xenobiotica]|nr:hypothetical protein LTS15_008688 [Exophiala xenobiotica]
MGWGLPTWLGGSAAPAQPEPARPKSQDGGFVAPDRNAREICWESRDIFFECLDKNNILDAIKEDDKARRIKYFKQKRVMEYDRDRTLQRIQQDDAKMVAKAKADRKGGSWFG